MNYYGYTFNCDSALQHHGILGQKWGVRRFQNKDGSLTNAGKKRYSSNEVDKARKELSDERKELKQLKLKRDRIESDTAYSDRIFALRDEANYAETDEELNKAWEKYSNEYKKALSHNKEYQEVLKKIETKEQYVSDLEEIALTRTGRDVYQNVLAPGLGMTLGLGALLYAFSKI